MRRRLRRHPALVAGALTVVAALALALLPLLARAEPAATLVARGESSEAAANARVQAVSRAVARDAAVPRRISRFEGRIPASTRQLVVVTASHTGATHGRVVRYRLLASGWQRAGSWKARLGYGGLVKGTRRVQGTGTTPMGAYAMTEAFGRRANPGTGLPYHRLTSEDWWVQDRGSRYYNERRHAAQGGFRIRSSGYNGSEHLITYGRQYDYVAVVDFNRPDPTIGRGSGIFLHVTKHRPTAGCVAIPHRAMRTVLRWLDPARQPMIVIGTRGWLRR